MIFAVGECKIFLIISGFAAVCFGMKKFFLFLGKTLDFIRNAGIMKLKKERKGSEVPWDAELSGSAFLRACVLQTADAAACYLLRLWPGRGGLIKRSAVFVM